MTYYVGSSDVKYKSGNEPVTEADRSANNHIVKRVREVFPEDGVLSEESKDDLSRLEKDRVWIIDPLGRNERVHCAQRRVLDHDRTGSQP